jgi:hypothetical protein
VQLDPPIWAADGITNLAGLVAYQETDLGGRAAELEALSARQFGGVRMETALSSTPHTNLADTMNRCALSGWNANTTAAGQFDNGTAKEW